MTEVLDLQSCEREPIRIPGSIQPAGWLFALEPTDFSILCASENVVELIGRDAASLTGLPFLDLLAPAERDALEDLMLGESSGDEEPLPLPPFVRGGPATELRFARRPEAIVVEIETAVATSPTFLRDLRSAVSRMQGATTLQRLCELATTEIARLSGFDRVMVYRFDEDWHGEVVAERAAPGVEAYLGLHYPASDIPTQARELYRTNWLRAIPDVAYEPVPLVPSRIATTGEPLDLGMSGLRSVSPIHVEYLKNMGVAATLTVSLLKNGALWGLVAAHHLTPRRLGYDARSACEFLGRTFSLQIAAFDENATLSKRVALKELQSRIYDRMADAPSLDAALARCEPELLALADARGVATRIGGRVRTIGRTPAPARIDAMLRWLDERREPVLATSALSSLDPRFEEDVAEASGLLAVPLGRDDGNYVVWFRPEQRRTVAWGGNPEKAATPSAVPGRLSPRTSFARWETIVRGRSEAWAPWHVAAAVDLHHAIATVVIARTAELERVNVELERSNAELDAFAHIASHDLKEPLRGIHNYASYLVEDYEDVLDDDGRDRLQTLVRLTQRMDTLIESLLHLARVGRVDFAETETRLDEVVDGVLDLYSPLIAERGFEVTVRRPLPTVGVDDVRVREVFNNLISNALKYNEKARPRIEIGFDPGIRPRAAGVERAEPLRGSRRWVTMWVRDNGIGIREKHLRTIFQMFKRLHPQSRFGGGTGAGLAICRKIVERFGGSIWAESVFGESTTFYFTLPEKG